MAFSVSKPFSVSPWFLWDLNGSETREQRRPGDAHVLWIPGHTQLDRQGPPPLHLIQGLKEASVCPSQSFSRSEMNLEHFKGSEMADEPLLKDLKSWRADVAEMTLLSRH